ncbi:hypothetical protein ACGFZP_13210 [Kitasatospora sp. NPDC048239]|uniref:hypothetical protein n=1 Tax=Kitasatospora sp. NPDC048239 TaxID=3364046 RepID=UPI00371B3610
MPGGTTRYERVQIADRRARMIQARIDGRSFDDIAADPGFGYSSSDHARKDFTRARRAAKEAEQEMVDLWVDQHVDRLEYYLTRLSPRIDRGEPRAIEVAVMVCKEIAKVQGLYAPTRAEVTIEQAPSATDLELRDMINEAKARQAAEEAQLRGGA